MDDVLYNSMRNAIIKSYKEDLFFSHPDKCGFHLRKFHEIYNCEIMKNPPCDNISEWRINFLTKVQFIVDETFDNG